MPKGRLFILPVPLTKDSSTDFLSVKSFEIFKNISHFIVENEKTARFFIRKIFPDVDQTILKILHLDKHISNTEQIKSFLKYCKEGIDIGLISESGCPGVADPGSEPVMIAHNLNIQVIPISGPNSILLALMASGLNGQNFVFNGYLPIDKIERVKSIHRLESDTQNNNRSNIFIETPYRNNQIFELLVSRLNIKTSLCVASMINTKDELIKTKKIIDWKKHKIDLHKKPTIFIIGKLNY